jgi:hypothetical protein
MALTPPFGGHCLCGAVTYACDAVPRWQDLCHCESCRRATGAPFAAYLGMADGHWRWTGAPPATFASSARALRFFCPACGSPLAYRTADAPDEMHFHAGTLDTPAAFTPASHDHHHEALPFVAQAHLLPGP